MDLTEVVQNSRNNDKKEEGTVPVLPYSAVLIVMMTQYLSRYYRILGGAKSREDQAP
jgi:hypothetical protein